MPSEIALTALTFLTDTRMHLFLTVLMFRTEMVATVLIFLTVIFLTMWMFLTELAPTVGYLLLNLFALIVLKFPPDLAYTVLDSSSRSHCLSFAQAQKEAVL